MRLPVYARQDSEQTAYRCGNEAQKLTNFQQNNRDYIPVSVPINWHRDPCNFLSDENTRSTFSSIEVTLNELPKATHGGRSPERPSRDYKLGIFNPIPSSSREGRRLETELIIDYTYMRKPP